MTREQGTNQKATKQTRQERKEAREIQVRPPQAHVVHLFGGTSISTYNQQREQSTTNNTTNKTKQRKQTNKTRRDDKTTKKTWGRTTARQDMVMVSRLAVRKDKARQRKT